MSGQPCQIGIIGLGVMGWNLAYNLADHHFRVAAYDKNSEITHSLIDQTLTDTKIQNAAYIFVTDHLAEFMQSLSSPKIIIILVPPGKPVETVIQEALPYLKPSDILIDCGNSYFLDTERRQIQLRDLDIHLLGVGTSGGQKGAREGPSLMVGGNIEAYEQVKPIFEAVAARVANEPCAAYLGPGGCGHYVKMVHNGIEYGMMQLIAETYDVFKRGLEFNADAIHQIYSQWNQTELNSFLLEVSAQIFTQIDVDTGGYLIDQIVDIAEEKGTGTWTLEEALRLHEPTPTINTAMIMRDISRFKKIRLEAQDILVGPHKKFEGDQEEFVNQLKNGLYGCTLITYIQGMALIGAASKAYGYDLNLEKIARVWRGGCIIRSDILNQMMVAFHRQENLVNLILDPYFSQELSRVQEDLRSVIGKIVWLGIPIPAFMASLNYYDAFRSSWLPANLIQAQRDYFGAHTYKRVDKEGIFHTQWISK